MKKLIALVYLRVSTEEQAEKGYSIQAQKAEGVNKAIEMGCEPENIHIFSDEGVSGAILERPQLMAAINMLKREGKDTTLFICYDSSRLSRSAAHQLILIDEIKKCNAQLVFLKNNYTDNAEGRFQLTVMAAVDEYERARLKLRTEMGKQAKASQHKLTHNPGLYGYNFDPITDELTINEEHEKNLKSIFYLLIKENKGPAEIAEILNTSEVPSPRMKQWTRITVRRILSNPSYMGTLYIRRYDTRECHLNKFRKRGEKIKVKERPKEEWIPVNIPKIIDRAEWEKAQVILQNSKHSHKKNERPDFLLASLLKCGICGSAMNGKNIVKDNNTYRYYICSKKYSEMKEERCSTRLLNADSIENAVWEHLRSRIFNFADNKVNVQKIVDEYVAKSENEIKNIIEKKEKAKDERERIITMYQKGFINETEMGSKLNIHEKRAARLVTDIDIRSGYDKEYAERLKTAWNKKNLPYIIERTLAHLNNAERKHILNLLISEIIVRDDTATINER